MSLLTELNPQKYFQDDFEVKQLDFLL